MKKKLLIAFAVITLLIGGGILAYRWNRLRSVPEAVWVALRQPEEMTLYSLHPEEAPDQRVGAQLLHGYRILGHTPVSTTVDRQRVVEEVKQAVLGASLLGLAACFNPRHGVRVSDGRSSYDLVICFECGSMELFIDDRQLPPANIGGTPDGLNSILQASMPQP